MWAVGCIAAELALGEVLFRGDSELELLRKMCNVLGSPTDATWPGLDKLLSRHGIVLPHQFDNHLRACMDVEQMSDLGLDLVQRLLCFNPSARLTAQVALQHSWLAS